MNSVFRRTLSRPLKVVALASVLVTAPAAAQQSSDRQAPQGTMAAEMILELQQMREELRELRGMVEAQAQELENLRQRQRDQYLDLDQRIGQLAERSPDSGAGPERGSPVTENTDATAQQPVQPDAGRPASQDAPPAGQSQPGAGQPPSAALPEVREPEDRRPEIATLGEPGEGGERELREPTEAERQAYDQAFRALRETRYADAAEGFDRFLRDHPDSSYAPNALYWLGEVYYVTRDFETALAQFQRLLETYPDSSKQPDALLKIGFSHYELGQWERARAALEQVIADYPGTNYSRLAENRLRTMRLEGHL